MGNAVEKGPDIKIQNPVLLPTPLSGHRQGVVAVSARTVAVTVRMEDRLQLLLQQHRCRGLGNPVGRVWDGGFILILLSGRVGLWT